MSACPTNDQLLEREAGVPLDDAGELHVASCATCQSRLGELAQLTSAIVSAGPATTLSAARVVAVALREPRRPWGLVALAAAVTVGVVAAVVTRAPADEFTARGAAAPWRQRLSVRVLAAPLGLVEADASIPADAVFTAAAMGAAPDDRLHVLAFVVDAKQQVHWIAPQWLDEAAVPAAPDLSSFSLGSGGAVRALSTSVGFDDLALGPAQLVTIVAEQPLSVLAIERLADKRPDALTAAFRQALVRVTPSTVTAGDAGR